MRRQGSVLIETLIAIAILATMLGVTFQAVGATAHRVRAIDNRSQAMLVARSRLAAVGSVIPARPGVTTGVDGPFAWRVDVSPYAQGALPLHRVRVSVALRGQDNPLASLASLRTAQS